ncbi:Hypothetical predicted protein, partial [Lynx pardinus]
ERLPAAIANRQKHYFEATAWQLQESWPGQAHYLLWAYSSSHNDNITFEGTCAHCFQWLILDNSQVYLKPKSKLPPKIQKLLGERQENIHSVLKKQKLRKNTKTPKVCGLLVKHATEQLNIMVKVEAFYPH